MDALKNILIFCKLLVIHYTNSIDENIFFLCHSKRKLWSKKCQPLCMGRRQDDAVGSNFLYGHPYEADPLPLCECVHLSLTPSVWTS